ncbi:hypothetical protein HDU97_009189 [Phlyctochytrium planicorne]|nr:hypothetical protein HDU97_009189 [Phlyctochytrium planicorne]
MKVIVRSIRHSNLYIKLSFIAILTLTLAFFALSSLSSSASSSPSSSSSAIQHQAAPGKLKFHHHAASSLHHPHPSRFTFLSSIFTWVFSSSKKTKFKGKHDQLALDRPLPPVAKTVPFSYTVQNTTIVDEFAWLKSKQDHAAVMDYVKAENDYMDAVMKPYSHIQKAYYDSLVLHSASSTIPSASPKLSSSSCGSYLPPSITSFWEQGPFIYWIDYPEGNYDISPDHSDLEIKRSRRTPDGGSSLPVYKRRRLPNGADLCTCAGDEEYQSVVAGRKETRTTRNHVAKRARRSRRRSDGESILEFRNEGSKLEREPAFEEVEGDKEAEEGDEPFSEDTIVVDHSEETILSISKLLTRLNIPLESPHFQIGVFEVNPIADHLVAVSFDLKGDEMYRLLVVDVSAFLEGLKVIEVANGTYYSTRWVSEKVKGNKGKKSWRHWVYYNVVDNVYGIPRIIEREGKREVVYTESDISFTTEVDSSHDGQLVYIRILGQETSETLLVSSSHLPHTPPLKTLGRIQTKMYDIASYNSSVHLVRINDHANLDYRVLRLSCVASFSPSYPCPYTLDSLHGAAEIVPHVPGRLIERIEAFVSGFAVIWYRLGAVRRAAIITVWGQPKGMTDIFSPPPSNVFAVFPGTLDDMENRLFRSHGSRCIIYTNSSFLTPPSVYGYHVDTGRTIAIQRQIPSALFGSNEYEERLEWIESVNGTATTLIPVTLLVPRNLPESSPMPFFLRSYGAYGGFQDPSYNTLLFPLLASGIAYAVCHPRGDADNGIGWYLDGKYENKRHTMDDSLACVGAVERLSRGGGVVLLGRSAGGLVAGTAVKWGLFGRYGKGKVKGDARNLEGGRVRGVVAQVPFVDPVGDMIDPLVPWTAFEWYEWGNPLTTPSHLTSMLQYSPYHTLSKSFIPPNVFISSGLNDPRVPFYEPLKFAAKIRSLRSSDPVCGGDRENGLWGAPGGCVDPIVLMRVTGQGHASEGDSNHLQQVAEMYAFVAVTLGVEFGG